MALVVLGQDEICFVRKLGTMIALILQCDPGGPGTKNFVIKKL